MKAFRSTFIFAAIVIGLGIFSIYEYKKSEDEKDNIGKKDQILSGLVSTDVNEIKVTQGTKIVRLQKANDFWSVLEPIKDHADAFAVQGFISDIAEKQGKPVEGAVDGDPFGLKTPMAEAEFLLASGKTKKVTVGSIEAFDGKVYVQIDGAGPILVVDSALKGVLNKSANELRVKKLYRVDQETQKISYKQGSENFTLVLKNGLWLNTKDEGQKLDASKINFWLQDLKNITATDFVNEKYTSSDLAKNGLASPDIEILLSGADKSKDWLVKVSADKEGSRYANTSQTTVLYKIGKNSLDKIKKTYDDLRDKKYPFKFDPTQANNLSLSTTGFSGVLQKKAGMWTMENLGEKKEVDSSYTSIMIDKLSRLEAHSFLKGKDPKNFKNKIILKDESGKPVFDISWGDKFQVNKTKDLKSDLVPVKTNLSADVVGVEYTAIQGLSPENILKDKMVENKAAEIPSATETKAQ